MNRPPFPALILAAILLTACTPVLPAASTPAPIPTASHSFPPATPTPTSLSITPTPTSLSITPTTVFLENGLVWTECIVPDREYSSTSRDLSILKKCAKPPGWSDADAGMMGERVKRETGFYDLQISIGTDDYEANFVDRSEVGYIYQLTKNGDVLLQATAQFTTYDPNLNLWNMDGTLVWELGGMQPVIFVDGENLNETYRLEGSYFPYQINGNLIFVARKNGRYSIVYDGKFTGPEFDAIEMAYCCAMVPLVRGSGQYWFVGSREGKTYLVSIR
ncbi:MAG TPA: hypothetical protein PKJ34_08355 [Anaerolineaceae bacterium]|nr:hypothetical protein [Anaerolineaceae bacterium]